MDQGPAGRVGAALLAALLGLGSPAAESAALFWLDPPGSSAIVGAGTDVDLRLDDVADVYGVDVELQFDADVLQVDGKSITPGACPSPDFVVVNTADNGAGTVSYAATALSPSPPCDGGVVGTIRFVCKAEGTGTVSFASSLVADTSGIPIPHGTQSAEVDCQLPALLWLNPADSTRAVGSDFGLAIQLDDILDVFGAEIELAFDPAVLEVPGAALAPGACPQADFVVANTADNATGVVEYAATQLNPTPPCDGGVVAEVPFRCKGVGDTAVTVTSSAVADPDGMPLPHRTQDAAIACVDSADLSVTKSDSRDPAFTGEPYAYTVTVTNFGPGPADAVEVIDTLPSGVTYDSYSGLGWACNHVAGVVTCTRASLPEGTGSSFVLNVIAPDRAGAIENAVSVTSAVADPDLANNTDTQTTSVWKSCSGDVVDLRGWTFVPGTWICVGDTSVTSGSGTVIKNGADVLFQAPETFLLPLFEVEGGGIFGVGPGVP